MQPSSPSKKVQRQHLLSVSSVGSEAMQPGPGGVKERLRNLSVSSVGSEAMQLSLASRGRDAGGNTFSILGRIGGDATEPLAVKRMFVGYAFSILGRIGGDATWGKNPGFAGHLDLDFQYPRPDRRRCNWKNIAG